MQSSGVIILLYYRNKQYILTTFLKLLPFSYLFSLCLSLALNLIKEKQNETTVEGLTVKYDRAIASFFFFSPYVIYLIV